MSDFDRNYSAVRGFGADRAAAIDQGLRAHMIRVYNYMAGGVGLTGIVAWLAYQAAGGDAITVSGRPKGDSSANNGLPEIGLDGKLPLSESLGVFTITPKENFSGRAVSNLEVEVIAPDKRVIASTKTRSNGLIAF